MKTKNAGFSCIFYVILDTRLFDAFLHFIWQYLLSYITAAVGTSKFRTIPRIEENRI